MNYLDTRDLVERETEIETEIAEIEEALEDLPNEVDPAAAQEDSANEAQLRELRAEAERIENLRAEIGSEFDLGETMIPTDEFEQYAEEFAADIGAISNEDQWPLECIDWEEAAERLAVDYVEVEWDGTDYYVRGR